MENPFEIIIEKLNNIEKLLLEINSSQRYHNQNSNLNSELMNIKQVAEYLSLAVPTIYAYVSNGEIPYIKRSKRLYFKKEEIDNWINKGRRKTKYEMKEEVDNFLRKSRK